MRTTDPADILLKASKVEIGEAALMAPYYYPIRTYTEFADVDPLSPVVGYLEKVDPQIKMEIQILITKSTFPWQQHALDAMRPKPPKKPLPLKQFLLLPV